MTMLDRMRRHRNWLKWSLGLVCLAFVIFYIPDFLRSSTGADAAGSDTVAVVQGEQIRADEFRRTYQAQLQSYRAAYGGNMNEGLLKQLGIDQQILQQMVDERAALAEADRLGLKISDEEVAQRIYAIPAFQENGTFIGTQRYQQLLASQRPPLTTSEFEDNVRRSLAVDKLRQSLTEWVSVSDKELEQEYRRRNDKVKLAVVAFNADRYRPDVTASDADVASYFAAHTGGFQDPREAQGQVSADRRGRAARESQRPASRRRACVQRKHRTVHDARTGPREPHPAQDRGKRRCRGEGQGRGRAQAGEAPAPISRRSPRSTRKTTPMRRTAAISTSSGRAGWCRSSIGSRSRWNPDRSAIW